MFQTKGPNATLQRHSSCSRKGETVFKQHARVHGRSLWQSQGLGPEILFLTVVTRQKGSWEHRQLTCWVILDKSLYLSEPWFPHLLNRGETWACPEQGKRRRPERVSVLLPGSPPGLGSLVARLTRSPCRGPGAGDLGLWGPLCAQPTRWKS